MKLIKAPVALVVLALAAEIAYIAVKGRRKHKKGEIFWI